MNFSQAMDAVSKFKVVARKGDHKFCIGLADGKNRLVEEKKGYMPTWLSLPAVIPRADILADDWAIIDYDEDDNINWNN